MATTAQIEDSNVKVDAKEPVLAKLPTTLSDEYRAKMGKLLQLTEEQERRIKGWLKNRIKEWIEDTTELHQKLVDDNDLVEGVVLETDFPFEGCSNVHVPVTETYMEVYTCIEKRSILGANILWYGETDLDELKDMLPDIEDLLNYKARHEWNIEKCLSNVFWTTNRDGLGVIFATWEETYEKCRDVVLITSEAEFLNEFPSPEDSGLSEEKYMEFWKEAIGATEEFPLEVPISFEKRTYCGVKGEVVELIDFVLLPAHATGIKDEICRGYGRRFKERLGTIRDKSRDEVYYKKAAQTLLQKGNKGTSLNTFRQNQDEIEGLSRTNAKGEVELYRLTIKGRLDGKDSEEEKYLVTYSYDHDVLLQMTEYPYRVDNAALFRINERPNRLIGRSIPSKTRDLNDEIDTQHNQRINSRTIGTVPSFKALNSIKNKFDPNARENKWRPGAIFWLDNFESFEQFKVQPTDLGESMSEETNDMKILDLYLGSAVSLLSGSVAPADPSAPGNKTAMMIQQSNLRMDDPLSELREGVSDLGNICLSLLYQFGQPILRWQSEMGSSSGRMSTQTKTLHKKFLRSGIHMNMSGITVTDNPDAEMAKAMQIHQILLQEPMYAQSDDLRVEGLRNALRAGRVPNRERMLPDLQTIQQHQMEMQKQAMMQQQMEQAMAQKAEAENAMKERINAKKREIQIRNLAQRSAAMGMGGPIQPPVPSPNGAPAVVA